MIFVQFTTTEIELRVSEIHTGGVRYNLVPTSSARGRGVIVCAKSVYNLVVQLAQFFCIYQTIGRWSI